MFSARVFMPLLISVCVFGQTAFGQIMAPPQPATGPGGSNYLYDYVQSGPYNAQGGTALNSYAYYIFSPMGLAPTEAHPNPLPTPNSAPVVLFIHGYDGNVLKPYYNWMADMARMGSTVVWVLFDEIAVAQWDQAVITDWKAALALLEAPTPGLIPPTLTPAGNPMTFFVGHSAGAYMAVKVAAEAAASSIPIPIGVVSVEPGSGQIPTVNPNTIAPTTIMVTVVGDQDKPQRICQAATIWKQTSEIPAAQKPFLVVRTDLYGIPQQLGNHWFPLTSTDMDNVPPPSIDNRDFNVTFKLSNALVHCVHDNNYCDYLYGNGPENQYGATTQTDMGVWSDGTPVVPMLALADPVGYYANACKGLK